MMVLVLCVPLTVAQCPASLAVAYLLVAFIAGCATALDASAALRVPVAVLLVLGCTFLPEMYLLTPFAAYVGMGQRSWAIRFVWLVPFCIAVASSGWGVSAVVAMLCAVSSVLAVRTGRSEAERKGMRAVRDGLREQTIGLAEENRLLAEELAGISVGGIAYAPDGEPDAGCAANVGSGVAASTASVDPAVASAAAFADLTDREQAVVGLIAEGYDNREIAGSLYLSEGTVRNHISAILQKKHLKNRTQIAIMYYRG